MGYQCRPGSGSPSRTDRVRRKQIDFRVASVDSLPFPDGSFDVATSTMMFHHLPVQIKERGFPHLLPHRQDVAFFVQAVALNLYNTQNVEPLTL